MASELATGSEWQGSDGGEIHDRRGYVISPSRVPGKVTVRCIAACDCYTVHAKDLLAVIDKAGLDPVRTAARELVSLDTTSLVFRETLKKLEALL